MRGVLSSFLLSVLLASALPLACGGTSDGDANESNDGASGAPAGAGGTEASGGSGTGGTSGSGGTSGTSGSGGVGAAGSGGVGAAGSGGTSASPLDCDHRKITCRRAEPECPAMQVPRVDGTCYGECVPIDECGCVEAEDCPHEESYTCHRSAMRCGPYVQ